MLAYRDLIRYSTEARKLILEMACRSKSAHVGSCLSCVDILTAAYFKLLRINKNQWSKRDIFILSKGHAAMALYAVLALKGFLKKEKLKGYLCDQGTLPAHLDRVTCPAIEVSAGSLGHGFNMGLGMAYGFKQKKEKRKVMILIGDGESEEGSIWEGALFASRLKLDNVTVFMDHNNLQGYGRPTELCHFEPILAKWRSFGWEAFRVDGHDFSKILAAAQKKPSAKPRIIICNTLKGKGVSFMEDQMKWHYFIVTDEIRQQAMDELCRISL
jgi:transketolase